MSVASFPPIDGRVFATSIRTSPMMNAITQLDQRINGIIELPRLTEGNICCLCLIHLLTHRLHLSVGNLLCGDSVGNTSWFRSLQKNILSILR